MKKIYLAGHKGMVGSAIFSILERQPDLEIITKTRTELDLCDQSSVSSFIKFEKPDEIIIAAARLVVYLLTILSSRIYLPEPSNSK